MSRWGKTRRMILVTIAILAMVSMSSFADWNGKAPIPSKFPWVYDFGTGWLTIDLKGQMAVPQVILKKVSTTEELVLVEKYNVTTVMGFQVMQVDSQTKKLKEISDFSKLHSELVFTFYFEVIPTHIVLIPDSKEAAMDLDLSHSVHKEDANFSVDLTVAAKGDPSNFVLIIHKWPAGDPKMGS
jgi:hypothetical protein